MASQPTADRAPAGVPTPAAYRVAWRHRETADTITMGIEPVSGARPRFAAGQFNMMYAFGVGEVPISISGNPLDSGPIVHTVRDVGAVSHALCALDAGATLGVRGPFGSDWGVDSAAGADLVIVAGGIGLAPLRSVITQVLGDRMRFGTVQVVIGARTAADLPFRPEIEAWRAAGEIDVHVTVDRSTTGWSGTVAVVTSVLPRLAIAPDAIAMVCGPEVMMRLTALTLLDRGLDASRIRLSMERNMQCAIGQCGHCQLSAHFLCADGPVLTYEQLAPLLAVHEL